MGKWTDILLCRPPAPPPAPPAAKPAEVMAFELMLKLFNERPETWIDYQGSKLVEMSGYPSNKYAMLTQKQAGIIIQYAWDHARTSPRAVHVVVDGEVMKLPYDGERQLLAALVSREVNLQRKLDNDRAQKQLKRLVEVAEELL